MRSPDTLTPSTTRHRIPPQWWPWCSTGARLVLVGAKEGRVKFEFVGLAYLDQGTTESLRSAAAATCAADADKFLTYHDALYDQQSPTENSGFLTNQRLRAFGREAGITDNAFTRCVDSDRYEGWGAQEHRRRVEPGRAGHTDGADRLQGREQRRGRGPARLAALVDEAAGGR